MMPIPIQDRKSIGFLKPIPCLGVLLAFSLFPTYILSAPQIQPYYINIGVFGDKYNAAGNYDETGARVLAGILLGIKEVNNKRDNIFDGILPNTTLRFALRESRNDYLLAGVATQDFVYNVFKNEGVKAIIGTGYDISSSAMGQLVSHTPSRIVSVDFGATDTVFSHGSLYPYYARTNPSKGFDGRTLARLIKYYFGWSTVNLFSTSNTVYTDTAEEFKSEAELLGINIENHQNYWAGTTAYRQAVTNMQKTGILKIFVIIMDADDAGPLLETGYNATLFTTDTQILGPQSLAASALWEKMSPSAPVADILKGLVVIQPYLNRDTPEFKAFIKRYLSQSNTRSVSALSGSTSCLSTLDTEGKTFLYKKTATTTGTACSGVTFSALAKDGSGVEDKVAYAYDAVIALATGLHIALYKKNLTSFTGDDLIDIMLNEVDFTGVTGRVNFFEGLEGGEGYGMGDRQIDISYKVLNFNPSFFHRWTSNGVLAFRTVGYWDADTNVLTKCQMDYDDYCTPIVYNSATNGKASDSPRVIEVELESWVRSYLTAGAVVGLILMGWYLFILLLYLDTRLMKISQPIVLFLVLFGSGLGSMHIILASVKISDSLCITRMWLGHLAFICVFSALFVKSWALRRIIRKADTKVKITTKYIKRSLGSIFTVFCALLVVNTFIGQPHKSFDESFDGHNLVRLMTCRNKTKVVSYTLFALEGIMLFYGAKVGWDTKDAPDAVSDTTFISLAQYLIAFVCAVTFPLAFLSIDPTPENVSIARSSGFIIATIGVLFLLFGKRTFLVLEGADVDENLQIVRESGTQGRGSVSAYRLMSTLSRRLQVGSESSSSPNGSIIGRSSIIGRAIAATVLGPASVTKSASVSRLPNSPTVDQVDSKSGKSVPVATMADSSTNDSIKSRNAGAADEEKSWSRKEFASPKTSSKKHISVGSYRQSALQPIQEAPAGHDNVTEGTKKLPRAESPSAGPLVRKADCEGDMIVTSVRNIQTDNTKQ